jgi:hypothetical protein
MDHARKIETRKISALKPHPRNVRTHPAKQIRLLVNSVKHFGVTSPPLIDETDIILAGAARVIAAQKAGLDEIPVIVRRGLSEVQKIELPSSPATIGQRLPMNCRIWPPFLLPKVWILSSPDLSRPKLMLCLRT